MAFVQGVKYLKINKIDANGVDKTSTLRQLENIRVQYSDAGIIQYNIQSRTEYPDYFLYGIDYLNQGSTVHKGVENYRLQVSASVGGLAVLDGAETVAPYDVSIIGNDRFNESTGLYTIPITEHYPNTALIITASVDYAATSTYPIEPIFNLVTTDGVVASATAGGTTNIPGTLTLTASITDFNPNQTQIYLQVNALSTDGGYNVDFTNVHFDITQSVPPSSTTAPILTVPSPNTSIKFESTDCDVTYGFVDTYPVSQYYMDVDYSTGITIPTNQQALLSGAATLAPVKDYYYTLQSQTLPRYQGSRVSQLELNKYTPATPGVFINGVQYPGDISFGKTPNVEQTRAYFGWFSEIYGATPEVNNAVNINIKYLVDSLGYTYSPELISYFTKEIQDTFTEGEVGALNFVDDVNGTNTTGTLIKSALTGDRRIIKTGKKAAAVLYSQTGSAGYTSSIFFTLGPGVQAQIVPIDHTFKASSASVQYLPSPIATASFTPEYVFGGNTYNTTNHYFEFATTPTSWTNVIAKFTALWESIKLGQPSYVNLYLTLNGVKMTEPTAQKSILFRGKTFLNAYQYESYITLSTGMRQFQQGDKIQVIIESQIDRGLYLNPTREFYLEQASLSYVAANNSNPVTASFFFTNSADYKILTASSQFKSVGGVYQIDINNSGFDPITQKATFNVGDQLRFENDEAKVYTINKIISSSVETKTGETHLLLDKGVAYGTDVNFFLLRRFIDYPNNIIVEGIKPSGGTGAGTFKPKYITQQLSNNIRDIIQKLNRENTI